MISEADLWALHTCAHTCKHTNTPTQNKNNTNDRKNEALRNHSPQTKTGLAENWKHGGWVANRKGFTIALSTLFVYNMFKKLMNN